MPYGKKEKKKKHKTELSGGRHAVESSNAQISSLHEIMWKYIILGSGVETQAFPSFWGGLLLELKVKENSPFSWGISLL